MAPELLKTEIPISKRITPKCDVFSLGASLLEISSSLNLPHNGELWQKLREGNQIVFSPSANRSSYLERLINDMMNPDPNLRPSIEKVLMHPCIQSKFNKVWSQSETPIPLQSRKATIIISPSTVAHEMKQSRKSTIPFKMADGHELDQPNQIGRTDSFKMIDDFMLATENQSGKRDFVLDSSSDGGSIQNRMSSPDFRRKRVLDFSDISSYE